MKFDERDSCRVLLAIAAMSFGTLVCGASPSADTAVPAVSPPPSLNLTATGDESGILVLRTPDAGAGIVRVLESDNLRDWREFALLHGSFEDYRDWRGLEGARRFFRIEARPITDEDDWKNQVTASGDAFLSAPIAGQTPWRWIKFIVLLDDTQRVYFQDSAEFSFHYPFAQTRLGPFEHMTADEFDQATLYPGAGQLAVIGAVILSPDGTGVAGEVGIQFSGKEPFHVDHVAAWFERVRSRIVVPQGVSFLYIPAFEQGGLSDADLSSLAGRGIHVGYPERWLGRDACYSEGWAYGRILFVPGAEIESAFAEGRLGVDDILLTDAVPARVPPVAGIVALSPATPNSHAAILARGARIPFVYVADESLRARLNSLSGKTVLLTLESDDSDCLLKVLNVDDRLTDAERARLETARQPLPIQFPALVDAGRIAVPVRDLTPDDSATVGGKAANLGLLVRAIPEHSPTEAIAFTFDLWNQFMDQTLPGRDGKTPRQLIRERLAEHTYPPDAPGLRVDLAWVRDLIRNEAAFDSAQQAAILEALSGFDPGRKLRFRSSSNLEDGETFTGAGLYDSYSGCVLDDLDADEDGPSHCDAGKKGESGVFRAIQRVYASFFNDNAKVARLRHQVPEENVGMAILVHYSFPDEIELANGVATVRVRRASSESEATLVTQTGAVSVANPEPGARPEVVTATISDDGQAELVLDQASGLVPLGGTVLSWPDDYEALSVLLDLGGHEYLEAFPERTGALLDLEYKKIEPGRLVVKQIREIPEGPSGERDPPFVIDDLGSLKVFQHHGKDLFANHRLKSIWQFEGLRFVDVDPTAEFDFDFIADVEFQLDHAVQSTTGFLSELENASIQIRRDSVLYSWTWGTGDARRENTLTATFDGPIRRGTRLTLGDAVSIDLAARYVSPQIRVDLFGDTERVTEEATLLKPMDRIIDGTIDRTWTIRKGRVAIRTSYTLGFLKWGVPGIGIFDTKSFPFVAWNGTSIAGLTREPIILNGEFSQTYDSTRHNFFETFLFEPGLEPGISAESLAELEAVDIRYIMASGWTAGGGVENADIKLIGFDGVFRSVE